MRAGSFTSVAELVEAIATYLASRNENPKPYKWKADGAKTLAKIQRAREALAGTVAGSRSDPPATEDRATIAGS